MSILNPNGDVDTYEMKEGDIYFIPKDYPRHIESLGNEPLQILIFFDQPMPKDIGLTASIPSYSEQVICPVLGITPQFFKQFPKYYEDLFIVKRINPADS